MTEYLTEQEQIQQLKNWAKQYGPTILIGIILALGVTSGWHYWQNYKNKVLTQASQLYDEMLGLKAQRNTDTSASKAQQLIKTYPKTPYASIAALLLADQAIQKNNYLDAHTQLNWVIKHDADKAMLEIARLRNARIFITENKPQAALDTLKTIADPHFLGLSYAIKGDAFLALNDSKQARQAYQTALDKLPLNDPGRALIQMKFDNLADASYSR